MMSGQALIDQAGGNNVEKKDESVVSTFSYDSISIGGKQSKFSQRNKLIELYKANMDVSNSVVTKTPKAIKTGGVQQMNIYDKIINYIDSFNVSNSSKISMRTIFSVYFLYRVSNDKPFENENLKIDSVSISKLLKLMKIIFGTLFKVEFKSSVRDTVGVRKLDRYFEGIGMSFKKHNSVTYDFPLIHFTGLLDVDFDEFATCCKIAGFITLTQEAKYFYYAAKFFDNVDRVLTIVSNNTKAKFEDYESAFNYLSGRIIFGKIILTYKNSDNEDRIEIITVCGLNRFAFVDIESTELDLKVTREDSVKYRPGFSYTMTEEELSKYFEELSNMGSMYTNGTNKKKYTQVNVTCSKDYYAKNKDDIHNHVLKKIIENNPNEFCFSYRGLSRLLKVSKEVLVGEFCKGMSEAALEAFNKSLRNVFDSDKYEAFCNFVVERVSKVGLIALNDMKTSTCEVIMD